MERVFVLFLLVGTMFCLTVEAGPRSVEDLQICPSLPFDSCDSASCSCGNDYNFFYNGTEYNCTACEMEVAYQVEFVPANSSCYDYFNETNLALWFFRGISHQPSCDFNNETSCCTNETVQDHFNTTGLNMYAMLRVTQGYPYVSLIADYEVTTTDDTTSVTTTTSVLSIGVDRLRLCNGDSWPYSVRTCGVYRYSSETQLGTTCIGECADTVMAPGCFSLTRVSTVPDVCTPTPMTSPTANGTSAGSAATHSLGLVAFLFILLQFFLAVIN